MAGLKPGHYGLALNEALWNIQAQAAQGGGGTGVELHVAGGDQARLVE